MLPVSKLEKVTHDNTIIIISTSIKVTFKLLVYQIMAPIVLKSQSICWYWQNLLNKFELSYWNPFLKAVS